MENMPEYLLRSYGKQKQVMITEKLPKEGISLRAVMEDYEKEIITKAIEETGTIAEASRKLNISKQDLNYKMKNTDSGDLLLLWERCRKKIFTDVKSFSLNDLESKKFFPI